MTHKRKRGARRFLQIDSTVYGSAAWRALPDAALRLWVDLRTVNNGHNNGRIAPTFATLRPLGWTSKSKHERALAVLVEHGFLRYTRKTGPNAFHRAALVRFTDIPCPHDEREGVDGCGPTCEFAQWREPESPRFAFPSRRGGTAPPEGEQPPLQKGNASPEPPLQKGNAKTPLRHRENHGPQAVARRSPSGGEDIDVAIPSGSTEATADPGADRASAGPGATRSLVERVADDRPTIIRTEPPWVVRKREKYLAAKVARHAAKGRT